MMYKNADTVQQMNLSDAVGLGGRKRRPKKTKATNRRVLQKLKPSFVDVYESVCAVADFYRQGVSDMSLLIGSMFHVYSFCQIAIKDLESVKNKLDRQTFYFLNYTLNRLQGISVNFVSAEDPEKSSNLKGDLQTACYQMIDHLVRTDLVDYKKDFPFMVDTRDKAHYKMWAVDMDADDISKDFKYTHRY